MINPLLMTIAEPSTGGSDVTDGLVAHYPLATNSTELISSFNGSDSNMTYNGNEGVFNGTSSYIGLPTGTVEAITGASACTVTFFANKDVDGVTMRPFWFQTQTTDSPKIFCSIDTSNILAIGVRTEASDAFQPVATTATFTGTAFRHFAIKIDIAGDSIQLFENGIEVSLTGTTAWTNTTFQASNTSNHKIGAYGAGGANFWDGNIAEFRLYDRALSDSEILAVFDYSKDNYI